MIELIQNTDEFITKIRVIGVGGAGGNAVNNMIDKGINGVEFIVANTDIIDLRKSKAKIKLQIGKTLTRGHGGGANPEVGENAAIESEADIKEALEGTDMLFIAAGFGGGTGTGAAPIIAKIAKELGILTYGVITKPKTIEGSKRMTNFRYGLNNIRNYVDSYLVIPNDRISCFDSNYTFIEAFQKADDVIYYATKAMSDIINLSGLINVDFADVKAVLENKGYSMFGYGDACDENRAINATKAAISNPLLNDVKLEGCSATLVNITCGKDFSHNEFDQILELVNSNTGNDSNTIAGVVIDDSINGKISITIFAAGLIDNNIEKNTIPTNPIKKKESPVEGFPIFFGGLEDMTQSPSLKKSSSGKSAEITGVPEFMKKFNK